MSAELRPLGVKCNLQCSYCYQNPIRDAGNVPNTYDIDKMLASAQAVGGGFTLFGGEPLLVPEADLEKLFRWGYALYGQSGIQTNATLLNERHVRMFQAYNVSVGISVDGPIELNDLRWGSTLEDTRALSAKSHAAIRMLIEMGVRPAIIVTLHRMNGSPQNLPRLMEWMREMDELGITAMRVHVLEADSEVVRNEVALTTEENLEAFQKLAVLEGELSGLRFDFTQDISMLLLGSDQNTSCIWNACDPLTTRAVQGVEGFGQTSNCGRTNKFGAESIKAEQEGFERYIALARTPMEDGGCQGCRFFFACKGQCPGTAIDGDWRNRTADCSFWYSLMETVEANLQAVGHTPLSVTPGLLKRVEELYMDAWISGRNPKLVDLVGSIARGDSPLAEDGKKMAKQSETLKRSLSRTDVQFLEVAG
jgi:radical SAM protein with 4Fe4S-binding SPASM domain